MGQEKNVRQIAFSEWLPFTLIIGNYFGTSNSNEFSSKNIKRKEVIHNDIKQKDLDTVENKTKINILSKKGSKMIMQKLDNTDPPIYQNTKTNPSKEKSKAKKKTTVRVTKAKRIPWLIFHNYCQILIQRQVMLACLDQKITLDYQNQMR